jgi:hypothetical protein
MTVHEISQQSLFAGMPTPAKSSPLDVRFDAMRAAEDKASDEWKREYEAFILRYLEKIGNATAEDIRLQYEYNGLPQPGNSKRASGAIFVRLARAGKIRQVGYKRSQNYGNDLKVYELV